MPHAIIDLGTNTFNLLVFSQKGSAIEILHSQEFPVFLGKGGLEKGRIAPEAFDRGIEALRSIVPIAEKWNASPIKGIGCSTFRNAANAKEFIREAERLGISIDVVRGDEEAAIILDGVRQAVQLGDRPSLIMDIGGGSIEFILATEKALMWKQSFELGVTRLRERIPISDPITMDEELRIAEHLDAHLEPLWQIIDRHEPHLLIGSAGSFDSLAAMIDPDHHSDQRNTSLPIDAKQFDRLKDELLRMPHETRSGFPGLPAHRVDTIIYALIAIDRVLTASGIRTIAWSRYSLKEGAAWRMLQQT